MSSVVFTEILKTLELKTFGVIYFVMSNDAAITAFNSHLTG